MWTCIVYIKYHVVITILFKTVKIGGFRILRLDSCETLLSRDEDNSMNLNNDRITNHNQDRMETMVDKWNSRFLRGLRKIRVGTKYALRKCIPMLGSIVGKGNGSKINLRLVTLVKQRLYETSNWEMFPKREGFWNETSHWKMLPQGRSFWYETSN